MKHRISAVLMLSLMLSMIFIPLSASADTGKSIIKGMVQAPADYSVDLNPEDYEIYHLWFRSFMGGYGDIDDRVWDYFVGSGWAFWRLPLLD